MSAQIPTEEEVLGYFQKLSNWGRWGPDDELGTPNLITPEKTKRALATVQEGVTVSLSRDVLWEGAADVPSPPVHFMLESGEGWASGQKAPHPKTQLIMSDLAYVVMRLGEYYTNEEVRAWLYARHPQLDGARAIDLIHADRSEEVIAILDRLDADAYL